jgi:Fe-S-cluster containining protein
MESACLRCGKCCTQFGVCVTPYDIHRIKKATGLKPDEFIQVIPEQPGRDRQEPSVLIDGELSLIVLKWKALAAVPYGGGSGVPGGQKPHSTRICMFTASNGCTIHADRPMVCRTYPFSSLSSELTSTRSRICPSQWVPGLKERELYAVDMETYRKKVEEYKELATVWNQNGGGSLSEFVEFALGSLEQIKES